MMDSGYSSTKLTKELRAELRNSTTTGSSNGTNFVHPRVVERRDGSSILRVNYTSKQHDNDKEEEKSIRLGHVLTFQPLSVVPDASDAAGNHEQTTSTEFQPPVLVSIAMANFLGVEDFNRRHFPFHPELAERVQDCDLYFSVQNGDTQGSPLVAGRLLVDAVWGSMGQSQSQAGQEQQPPIQPTFIVGATLSDVVPIVSTLGAVAGSALPTTNNGNGNGTNNNSNDNYGSPIPNFSGTAGAPLLEDTGRYPYFGRLVSQDFGGPDAVLANLRGMGVTHVGVLYSKGLYGQGYMADLRRVASKPINRNAGMTIYEQSFQLGIPEELVKAVANLKESGLRYFVCAVAAGSILEALPELYHQGLLGHHPGEDDQMQSVWTFPAATRASLSLTQTQGDLPGLSWEDRVIMAKALNGTAIMDFGTNLPNLDTMDQRLHEYFANDTLLAEYEALFGNGKGPNFMADWDRTSISRGTYMLLSYDVGTAVGLAACEAESELFDGAELFEAFKNVTFLGASGQVDFDPVTGTRSTTSFPIGVFNIQSQIHPNNRTISYVEAETKYFTFTDPTLTTFTVEKKYPFRFPDGSINPPSQFAAVEERQNLIGTGALSFMVTISVGMALFSMGAGLWAVWNQELPKVKARQPFFLVLLCTGTFVMACSSLLATFQDSMTLFADNAIKNALLNVFCMLRPWLFSMGFILAFSALFAKSRRVYQLFKSSERCRRVTITYREVLYPFFIMITLDIALLVAWSAVSPLKWERVVVSTDLFGRTTESYGGCQSEHSTAFAAAIGVILVVALVVANVQSFLARKLPDAFQEASSLVLTNFILLECLCLGLPVLLVVANNNNPTALAVIESIIVLVLCLAILLPYFPKLMTAKGNEKKRNVSMSSDFHLNLGQSTSNAELFRSSMSNIPFAPTTSSHLQLRSSQLRFNQSSDDGDNPWAPPSHQWRN